MNLKSRTLIKEASLSVLLSVSLLSCGGGGGGSGDGGIAVDPRSEFMDTPEIPASPTVPTASGSTTLLGSLYYLSFWNHGFVHYDFKTQTETVLLEREPISQKHISISDDKQWLGYAIDLTRTLKVDNLLDPGLSFELDIYPPDYLEETPVFSPSGNQFIAEEKRGFVGYSLAIRNRQGVVYRLSGDLVHDTTGSFFTNYDWVNENSIVFTSGTYIGYIPDLSKPTAISYVDMYPNWPDYITASHDGTMLAYVKASRRGREGGDVYIMDQAGKERQLTENSDARSLAWSPDGKYIALVSSKWLGGADYGGGLCPPVHIIPIDLDERVTIDYGTIPSSDRVLTLQLHHEGRVEDVCTSGPYLNWVP